MSNTSSRHRPKPKPRRSKPNHGDHTRKPSLDTMSALFVGCPRCGFFLSGYRARVGIPKLKAAIEKVQDVERDWLVLGWQHSMLELLERTYGCEIPSDTLHFETRCRECGRVMILEQVAEETKSLRIQAMPRIRYLNRD